jgi:hypothetical protein
MQIVVTFVGGDGAQAMPRSFQESKGLHEVDDAQSAPRPIGAQKNDPQPLAQQALVVDDLLRCRCRCFAGSVEQEHVSDSSALLLLQLLLPK